MHVHHRARFGLAALLVAALAALGIMLASWGVGGGAQASAAPSAPPHRHSAVSAGHLTREAALAATMRTLWDQHMAWTWSAVVAFAEDSPALQPTIDRLLANQADTGNAIAPFYGRKAARQLTGLLQTHIKQAVPVLTAAKAGDKAALGTALDAWYANARQIADFLASANSKNWSRRDLRPMMRTHITQTTRYAAEFLGGQYAQSIRTFDRAQKHMDHLADTLSAGLVAQFPQRF